MLWVTNINTNPVSGWGFPKIVSCDLYFVQDEQIYVLFYKDSDKDGVDDFNDEFPNDPTRQ
tara:strand:- start:56 stop:238 length:183 start_codon:yes stop_codon:yes gene_type:complete